MSSLLTLCHEITEHTGRLTRYLSGFLVAVTFLVVLLRYGFHYAPIALQETMTYLHAALFMLGATYTLKHNGHVRVDVFYQNMSVRRQAWVNLLGTLFLLFPTCLFVLIICWPYVADSWAMGERSIEGSGLPFVYLLKSLLIIQPVLLMVQGLAMVIENSATLVTSNNVQDEGGQ